jgi:hypothetical protein
MSKYIWVCTECGSPEVLFDAFAKWNEDTQKLELHSTFDATFCEVCEGSCKVQKINTDDNGESNKGRANLSDFGF